MFNVIKGEGIVALGVFLVALMGTILFFMNYFLISAGVFFSIAIIAFGMQKIVEDFQRIKIN